MRLRNRRTAVVVAATMLVGIGAMQVATGSPAAAAPPGGCFKYQTNNDSGSVFCSNIEDGARVIIICTHAGSPYKLYGPWIYGYGTSSATCHAGDVLGGAVPPEQNIQYDFG